MSQRRSKKSLNKSQSDSDESDPTEFIEESVKRCVRYFLVASEGNYPIKKNDIKKNVPIKTSGAFQLVMKETTKALKDIFGYKVVELEDGFYVLLKNFNDDKNPKKILTLLVLSHVFMSGDSTSEASMKSFLNSLNIDLEKNHDFFGNVKEFVFVTLEKQKYLSVVVDDLTKIRTFKWGARAEATICKETILKFVCEIYNTRRNIQPEQFKEQFEKAQQQNFNQ
nr:non-structural maintenance of chromosomes element 3 homolog [Onthophagus taurus]